VVERLETGGARGLDKVWVLAWLRSGERYEAELKSSLFQDFTKTAKTAYWEEKGTKAQVIVELVVRSRTPGRSRVSKLNDGPATRARRAAGDWRPFIPEGGVIIDFRVKREFCLLLQVRDKKGGRNMTLGGLAHLLDG